MRKEIIWWVHKGPVRTVFSAERIVNGRAEDHRDFSSHCLACAKADIMVKTGEPADIRGWNLQGMCGSFLKATRDSLEAEDKDDE